MKNIFINILFSVLLLINPFIAFTADHSVPDLFLNQIKTYPQEKIYVQTDKTYYLAGEDVWFRAFLADNMSLIPDTTSRYIYAELINPNDSLVTRVKIRPENGAYHGYITLSDNLAAGDYQLRFYTRYMENLGEDYFYRKRITVGNHGSGDHRIKASSTGKGGELTELRFVSGDDDEPVIPERVRIRNGKGLLREYGMAGGNAVRLPQDKDLKNNVMYVEYDYQGRTHKQYIHIPAAETEYDVSFFPEGGSLPAGTMARVAFKALNPDGLGEPVSGFILNGTGDTLTSIESNKLGMGSFPLIAGKGQVYTAVCRNAQGIEKRVALPVAQDKAISLHVTNSNGNINIAVKSSSGVTVPENMRLIIHCRGRLLCDQPWNTAKDYMSMDCGPLPSGILHAILVDSDMNPLSERLVFNLNKDADFANLTFTPERNNYGSREKVVSQVKLTDPDGMPLEGSFAVSVTDAGAVLPDTTNTILTTMLLTSDIRGHIESPGYYFSGTKQAESDLDMLMMTQGWRRYNIARLLKGDIEEPKIGFETGPGISGTLTGGMSNKPIENADMSIFAMEYPFVDVTTTDKAGRFVFNNFELPDSTRYMVKGANKRDKGAYDLKIDKVLYPDINIHIPAVRHIIDSSGQKQYVSAFQGSFIGPDGIRTIQIQDVVIRAQRNEIMSRLKFNVATQLDANRIEGSRDVLSVIMQLGTWPTPELPPWIFLSNGTHIPWAYKQTIPVKMIEKADGIKIKGILVAVIITMKPGFIYSRNSVAATNMEQISPLGYQSVKEFYSPKYETREEKENPRPDFRTTVYWNPDVRTNINGTTQLDFYTSDSSNAYSVVIEGLTPDGRLISATKKIERTR